ncbi:MAG TPA: zf-HC2 domain-containing protein [Symbiobacteriaceae bacterium]|nr:zf-HC2 domain-containing protein [Symbiobacteriaceae bacterium]
MTTCQFSREAVALFAGGDLPPEESPAVAEHVAGCEDCTRLVRQHQAIRAALQDALCVTPAPEAMGRVPEEANQPRWWRAAAIALAAVIVVACASPLAVRWLRIRDLDREQTIEMYRQSIAHPAGQVAVSRADAEEALGRPLAEPGFIPDGYAPVSAILRSEREPFIFTRRWSNPGAMLMISQMKPDRVLDLTLPGDYPKRYVMVNGKQALLVDGEYVATMDQDGVTLGPASPVRELFFSIGDQLVTISSSQVHVVLPPPGFHVPEVPLLSSEELIQIAESLH